MKPEQFDDILVVGFLDGEQALMIQGEKRKAKARVTSGSLRAESAPFTLRYRILIEHAKIVSNVLIVVNKSQCWLCLYA